MIERHLHYLTSKFKVLSLVKRAIEVKLICLIYHIYKAFPKTYTFVVGHLVQHEEMSCKLNLALNALLKLFYSFIKATLRQQIWKIYYKQVNVHT